ncbi:GTPase-activating protein [Motilimonas cestriensis]|uniref:Der GTPase-activating protein YihI n=1 Tax=Motilimonas cestriensis TaxID=2742685 RepID=A0ABS8W6B9_9GAMM|nr:Der GTPase-activating protein YihI [Motilimonas cestriensis]MCE2593912.1 GTPase-activating protein [Motilimonas cestriensis]
MSRQKKTRKVNANGPKMGERIKVNQEEARLQKKLQKRKGLKAGNRNAEEKKAVTSAQTKEPIDPRAGSKKPIALTPEQAVELAPVKLAQHQPKAKLVKAKPKTALSPEKELARLEADERLGSLLDKIDEGEKVSSKDLAWVNQQMERHQVLLKQLGLLDEDDSSRDEDEMLDAFSNLDDSWLQDVKNEREKD